jgi:hypothetical protein
MKGLDSSLVNTNFGEYPRKKEEKKCKIPEELLDHCYLHTYDTLFEQVK